MSVGPAGPRAFPEPDPMPDDGAPAPGATHPSDRSARALRGDAGIMSDPGVHFVVAGGAVLPGGIPRAPGGSDPASLRSAIRPMGGGADLEVRTTNATASGGTVTGGVRVAGAARLDAQGVDRLSSLMTEGARVKERAKALNDPVSGLMRSISGSRDIARLRELAAAAGTRRLTPAEMGEALALAGKVETTLRRSRRSRRCPGSSTTSTRSSGGSTAARSARARARPRPGSAPHAVARSGRTRGDGVFWYDSKAGAWEGFQRHAKDTGPGWTMWNEGMTRSTMEAGVPPKEAGGRVVKEMEFTNKAILLTLAGALTGSDSLFLGASMAADEVGGRE